MEHDYFTLVCKARLGQFLVGRPHIIGTGGFRMNDQECTVETPADFLAQLAGALVKQKGADQQLAQIITEHLLTVEPTDSCVVAAKTAITKLAENRASMTHKGSNA